MNKSFGDYYIEGMRKKSEEDTMKMINSYNDDFYIDYNDLDQFRQEAEYVTLNLQGKKYKIIKSEWELANVEGRTNAIIVDENTVKLVDKDGVDEMKATQILSNTDPDKGFKLSRRERRKRDRKKGK